MKELNLTTWERLRLIRIITAVNATMLEQMCDLTKLRKFLSLTGVLELTEKEKVSVGMVSIGTAGQSTWTNTEHEFELSFEDADYALLLETVRGYGGWSPVEGHFADVLGKKFGV